MINLLLIPQTYTGQFPARDTAPGEYPGGQVIYGDTLSNGSAPDFLPADSATVLTDIQGNSAEYAPGSTEATGFASDSARGPIYIPGDAADIPSFFTGHQMSPGQHLFQQERTAQPGDWIFLILLLALLILTLARLSHARKLSAIFQAVFSRPAESLMLREGAINKDRIFIPLYVIYLLSISTFFYLVFDYLFDTSYFDLPSLAIFSLFLLGVFIAMMLKFFLMRLTGIMFRNNKITREYIHNILIFNLFSGIILVPLLFLTVYSETIIFIFISSGFLALILVYRFIRGMVIGLEDTKFSVFHLFLYLCSFEILPIVVATKIVTNAISLQS